MWAEDIGYSWSIQKLPLILVPDAYDDLLTFSERVHTNLDKKWSGQILAEIDEQALTTKRYLTFVDYLTQIGDCWVWTSSKTHNGYGAFNVGGRTGKNFRVHKLAHILWKGSIGEEMQCMHTCDNRPCCRPAHIYEGTAAENTADMMLKGRHKYENTNRFVTKELVEKMWALRNIGRSNVRIGKILGMSHETVRNYLDGGRDAL